MGNYADKRFSSTILNVVANSDTTVITVEAGADGDWLSVHITEEQRVKLACELLGADMPQVDMQQWLTLARYGMGNIYRSDENCYGGISFEWMKDVYELYNPPACAVVPERTGIFFGRVIEGAEFTPFRVSELGEGFVTWRQNVRGPIRLEQVEWAVEDGEVVECKYVPKK